MIHASYVQNRVLPMAYGCALGAESSGTFPNSKRLSNGSTVRLASAAISTALAETSRSGCVITGRESICPGNGVVDSCRLREKLLLDAMQAIRAALEVSSRIWLCVPSGPARSVTTNREISEKVASTGD